ncbi:MAG: prepilin-type N-terminal cleavage/methylation domain-containing protein [Phycisphaera sp.]|nr:prepilin-type N-terminal cleavage/methylation domain-containing protein [Phycisphaera sp.]
MFTQPLSLRRDRTRRIARGFSLVELVVVMGVIATIVLTLNRSVHQVDAVAGEVMCDAKMREITGAYLAYPLDNRGRLVFGYPDDNHTEAYVRRGAGDDAIRNGRLYDYIKDVDAWRCNADPNPAGNKRNYAIVAPMYGERYDVTDLELDPWAQAGVDHLSGVVNDSKQMVFVEEWDSRGWIVGSWMMKVGDANAYEWIDYTSNFHGDSPNFSFADGHVESHQFTDSDTIEAANKDRFFMYDVGNDDWEWCRVRYRQVQAAKGISLWQ